MNENKAKTLELRNAISIRLDDLTELIKSSSLAYEVRSFSHEVVETEPCFVFQLEHAKALKQRTDVVYDSFENDKTRNEADIMNYLSVARSLIKGDNTFLDKSPLEDLFNNILGRFFGARKANENAASVLERLYADYYQQFQTCKNEMQRAVENGSKAPKDSMVYRESARVYNRNKRKLPLLKQVLDQLDAKLEKLSNVETLKEYIRSQETIKEQLDKALGSEEQLQNLLIKGELLAEDAAQSMAKDEEFGRDFEKILTDNTIRVNESIHDEFAAMVAKNEAEKNMQNIADIRPEQEPVRAQQVLHTPLPDLPEPQAEIPRPEAEIPLPQQTVPRQTVEPDQAFFNFPNEAEPMEPMAN